MAPPRASAEPVQGVAREIRAVCALAHERRLKVGFYADLVFTASGTGPYSHPAIFTAGRSGSCIPSASAAMANISRPTRDHRRTIPRRGFAQLVVCAEESTTRRRSGMGRSVNLGRTRFVSAILLATGCARRPAGRYNSGCAACGRRRHLGHRRRDTEPACQGGGARRSPPAARPRRGPDCRGTPHRRAAAGPDRRGLGHRAACRRRAGRPAVPHADRPGPAADGAANHYGPRFDRAAGQPTRRPVEPRHPS